MIVVSLQPEPLEFNVKVRQKGLAWLAANGIALNSAPPDPSKLPSYWSSSNKSLWDAYSGTCAYLAIFFEWSTGASSTDHYVAKSQNAGDAYEWNNYRLSCLGANRNKNKFDDVIDPIGMTKNPFFLRLSTGFLTINPALNAAEKAIARKTIRRLKLNDASTKEMRARHYSQYTQHQHSPTLRSLSPFVWYEANRQGLL